MYIEIIILFITVIKIKCSIVIDEFVQKNVHISDYCPEIGECKEGSHVMCTHYDPNHEMGPLCAGVENATMTEEYASLLLDLINTIRSRAARGLAMGYDKELLPRAYGMYRVQWDTELAMLGQVWANQCIVQFDGCRSTKKFPDAGQLASITRFVTAKWLPLSKQKKKEFLNSPGFNKEKMLYAIKASVGSWYSTSEYIDSIIITDRNSSWTDDLLMNPFLQIIDGSVTHMGCGTSAFQEYEYMADSTHLIYNVIRLVCNFSSRVRDQRGIYITEHPTKAGFTTECGCPPGYDEDSGCLCYESSKNQSKPCKSPRKPGKFQVVVVPIITVEDYPRANADSMLHNKKYLALDNIQHQDHVIANRRYVPSIPIGKSLSTSPIFKLTSRKLKKDIPLNKIKMDVAPRKYFNETKNLLSNYLNKRRTVNLQNKVSNTRPDNHFRRSLPIKPIKPAKDNYIIRKTYKSWEDKRKYDLTKKENTSSNIKASKDEDIQLLSLLNNLENEANKINVSEKDRSVLNNSIRKIYSALTNPYLTKNNRAVIFNKKVTEKKPVYVPFIENRKLTIYEDLFKNISLKQKYKPRNLSLMATKFKNNTHLINSIIGKDLETILYKNHPGRHMYNTPQKDVYNKEYLKNYLKSNQIFYIHNHEYLPSNRKIYYSNKINDIRRKLKANYIKYIKSRSGLQIRPTFEASHLQFRQTLPNFEKYEVDAKRRDVRPYGSIYGSMERRLKLTKINTQDQREIESFENEKAEFPVYKHKRKKKKPRTVTNNNELLPTSSRKKEERKKINKKRKKKPKYNKRFIKTTLKNTDSNMSDSKEKDSKNKPVDIIVHIKMND